jgi:vitamin B12/bleomycin/antimicrobial peptide transport system ATP-binding/permease protein
MRATHRPNMMATRGEMAAELDRPARNARGSFAKRTWTLIAPYWRSDQKKWAWTLIVTVVGLTLGLVYINVLLNDWNRQFYNALEQRDGSQFQSLILYFCVLAAIFIVAAVYRVYLTQLLEIKWRTWLTDRYTRRWLDNRAYYRLELQNRNTDNPDQRIAEDLRLFTTGTLSLSLGLLSSVVTLASFVVILWTISGPLSFAVGETEVTIPGYMVWAAVLYAIVGSVLTHVVARRLIPINFEQERREADFRFSLVRLRENAEGVALYRGENSEHRHLSGRFARIQANWAELMRYTKRLTFFQSGYGQVATIFPILVVAPRFFAGEITLGVLFQVANAFRQVENSLSWFVDNYARLADYKASVDRLLTFEDALERVALQEGAEGLVVEPAANGTLRAEGLDLTLPTGAAILAGGALAVGRGVLVKGPSGSGKSTLFRALAGIWPFGRGRVSVPESARVLFLPQKPYLPIGTLRDAVSYPATAGTFSDDQIRAVLDDAALGHLAPRLDEADNWSMQQRLAIARALLHRPDYLFLDESTSALDEATEERMYALLRERLPEAALVSIAHTPTTERFHERILELVPADGGSTLRDGSSGNGHATNGQVSEAASASTSAAH